MESDAVVRFVITLILFQLLGIEIPACVCCHPVDDVSVFYEKFVYMGIFTILLVWILAIYLFF